MENSQSRSVAKAACVDALRVRPAMPVEVGLVRFVTVGVGADDVAVEAEVSSVAASGWSVD